MELKDMTVTQLLTEVRMLQDEMFYSGHRMDPIQSRWIEEAIEDLLDEIASRKGQDE